jgi:hypothetical protein
VSHARTPMGRLWTVTNAIMLLLFVFAAVVQVNDPDPLVWIGIYTAAAVVCGLELRRRTPAWAPLALSLLALAWAGSLYVGARDVPVASLFAEWEMRDLRIEEAREMYGLAIVAVWMLLIAAARWARRRPAPHPR